MDSHSVVKRARPETAERHRPTVEQTAFRVLLALSFSHLLNDTIQSLLAALYPVLKESFHLSFAQIGLITFSFQLTASLLQPLVGVTNDRRPRPYSLVIGMAFTLAGLILLSKAGNYPLILLAAALIGTGSSIFHPEASRLARLASGGRHGLAQSLFQVGGNLGTSLGPLLAALVVVRRGQSHILWFSLLPILGMIVLARIGDWYQRNLARRRSGQATAHSHHRPSLSRRRVALAVAVLLVLTFSKFFYLVSLTSYYTFYLISKFHLTIQQAQFHLFLFLFAVAAGTIIGGPMGDRFGRKYVIWISILGVAPFSLALPYFGLAGTTVLSIFIGLILASAFPAILVYAQELMPGNVGFIAGLFFGFAFGIAGISSALLGKLADHTSIFYVFDVCSFLPLIGLFTALLPNLERHVPDRSVQPAPP
ncbi:MAG: MFS transporter [Verrucomicrobiota bacterium]|nr:MFS transporter [Verrucomicrobiota bacterium]